MFTERNFAIGLLILAILYFVLTGILIFFKADESRYESDDDFVNADKRRKRLNILKCIMNDEENPKVENPYALQIDSIKETVPVSMLSPSHQRCHGRFIFELNQLKEIDSGILDQAKQQTER